LGIVSCLGLIFTVEPKVLWFFLYFMIAALIIYFVFGMHNSNLAKGIESGGDAGPTPMELPHT
jgi:basic amino acid/polyamine antiporter, APA family